MSETEKGASRLETYFRPLIAHLKTRTGIGEATLIRVREEDLTEAELKGWDDLRSLHGRVIGFLEEIREGKLETESAVASLAELLVAVKEIADRFRQRNWDTASPIGRRAFYNWLSSVTGSLLSNLEYLKIELEGGKRKYLDSKKEWDAIIGDFRNFLDRG